MKGERAVLGEGEECSIEVGDAEDEGAERKERHETVSPDSGYWVGGSEARQDSGEGS